MNITIDRHAGLCPGVRRAIQIAETHLEHKSGVAVLGALIHNQRELERLGQKGLIILPQKQAELAVTSVAWAGFSHILIRSHGVSPAIRQRLVAAGVNLIDATCPTVSRIQRLARHACERGDQVIVVGKKDHPEVQGILGYCEPAGWVVESLADLGAIDLSRRVTLMAQSTVGRDIFYAVVDALKSQTRSMTVADTTCRFLQRRLQQASKFFQHQEAVLVVGGKDSSNSRLVFALAQQVSKRCIFIGSPKDIQNLDYAGVSRVGITGGTSTPLWQLMEVKAFLEFETREGYK